MNIIKKNINELKSDPANARTHSIKNIKAIKDSLEVFGQQKPIVVDNRGVVIAGNGTLQAATELGWKEINIVETALDPAHAQAFGIADNRTAELADWDVEVLEQLMKNMDSELAEILAIDDIELPSLTDEKVKAEKELHKNKLSEAFGIPPFSVLNAREGWWQDRKRAWLSLGIKSELGRENVTKSGDGSVVALEYFNNGETIGDDSGSVFDPVITELAYRWFCPKGGVVVDPFAGGSVRGIVASKLGLEYNGLDVRAEQVEANNEQAENICVSVEDNFSNNTTEPNDLTPIETHGGYLVKRDDLFQIGGVNGGKVRTCWTLAQHAEGLVTAGSRSSPQVNIVAHIAKTLNIPCRVHTPEGELSPEVLSAKSKGAEIVQHKAGHNSVIIKRAKDDAVALGYKEIPFGMECLEAVEATRKQVQNLPKNIKRIVIPVGSGMSLSGLLHGLNDMNLKIPVLGVAVGAEPTKRLNKYAPKGWENQVTIIKSEIDYHKEAPETALGNLILDPIYEAKCLPFLEEGDLLWVVGIRKTSIPTPCEIPTWHCNDSREIDVVLKEKKADFIFSCPPYGDLEVYSDNPNDLSVLPYNDFRKAYFEIINKTCSLLRENSFACFVVGEFRDKQGNYQNFVGDTIQAFLDAGLHYYNEAIMVTPIGSLPFRAGRYFRSTRKLGKGHQNVLVFVKGDGKKASEACGECDFGEEEQNKLDET